MIHYNSASQGSGYRDVPRPSSDRVIVTTLVCLLALVSGATGQTRSECIEYDAFVHWVRFVETPGFGHRQRRVGRPRLRRRRRPGTADPRRLRSHLRVDRWQLRRPGVGCGGGRRLCLRRRPPRDPAHRRRLQPLLTGDRGHHHGAPVCRRCRGGGRLRLRGCGQLRLARGRRVRSGLAGRSSAAC